MVITFFQSHVLKMLLYLLPEMTKSARFDIKEAGTNKFLLKRPQNNYSFIKIIVDKETNKFPSL